MVLYQHKQYYGWYVLCVASTPLGMHSKIHERTHIYYTYIDLSV